MIASWHNRVILPGANWARETDEHLNQAEVVLLLISPDFLASDYCYEIEMQRAMQRQRLGEARVLPILLRPCEWSMAPFGVLQPLPRNGQPIASWRNQNEAFTHVVQQIRLLLTQPQRPTPHSTMNRQKRTRLLLRLQQWYQDYLTDSLQQVTWLAFLARQMRLHHVSAHAIEQLQPDWLPPPFQPMYRGSVGLIYGIGIVLFNWLLG